MAELDDIARQEQRRKAGEFLKSADKLFKSSDFEGAARIVKLAMEADPRNPYAIAYHERISAALARQSAEVEQSVATPPPARESGEMPPPPSPPEPPKPSPPETLKASPPEAPPRAVDTPSREPAPTKPAEGELRELKLRAKVEELTAQLEDLRKKHADEITLRHATDQQRLAAQAEERKRVEELIRRQVLEAEGERLEMERRRIAQEEAKKIDEERKSLEEEMTARVERERKRLEEWVRKETEGFETKRRSRDEEIARREEETKRRTELERLRLDEERRRVDEERSALEDERHKVVDLRQQLDDASVARESMENELRFEIAEQLRTEFEEERTKTEAEYKRQLDAERSRVEAETYQRLQAEMQQRLQEELRRAEEANRLAEEQRRVREQEAEKKRRAEEEERKAYEQAVHEAIEEGRRVAQAKKIRFYIDRGKEFVIRGQFDEALVEVAKAFKLNPADETIRKFEMAVYAAREGYIRREEEAKRLKAEQERKVSEIQQRIDDQERKDKEDEERLAMRAARINECLENADGFFRDGQFEQALQEIETVFAMDPGHAGGRELETRILSAQQKRAEAKALSDQRIAEQEAWKKEEERKATAAQRGREQLRRESVQTFRSMLKQSWAGGQPGKEERSMLEIVRVSLGVTESDHVVLEREVQLEVYAEALRNAWRSGIITDDDTATHENLRKLYGVAMEEHLVIEAGILREMKSASK